MDEVCRVQAEDVDAQDFARVVAVDHLGHAIALQLRQRLRSSCLTEQG